MGYIVRLNLDLMGFSWFLLHFYRHIFGTKRWKSGCVWKCVYNKPWYWETIGYNGDAYVIGYFYVG
jgi:hypothetical protein